MQSIKELQREAERLRLDAEGKHKEASRLGMNILAEAGDPMRVAAHMKERRDEDKTAEDFERQAAEIDQQIEHLKGEVVELEAQMARRRDQYEGDKARLEAQFKLEYHELEQQRLRMLG